RVIIERNVEMLAGLRHEARRRPDQKESQQEQSSHAKWYPRRGLANHSKSPGEVARASSGVARRKGWKGWKGLQGLKGGNSSDPSNPSNPSNPYLMGTPSCQNGTCFATYRSGCASGN